MEPELTGGLDVLTCDLIWGEKLNLHKYYLACSRYDGAEF
jgi:hypothetical protein